ncbi:MAG: MerR family transcriptional regulator [Armatimonadetes bacterium]|nr:MerR family transcriptional regulator [Armatimonadota bacterium]NIM22938.1 MerR family transcriptional regulator [Armatimonadota bacterium]NIM66809.1 MerR family transcriptional regulator [Armatimonadota bacterium]NIM75350.1 MerR family transcriptional regulator [Armatimonadota bacterium]NIN04997.1 MerR family transcriptional regulator [Armatimonadota bacterium]
MKSDPSDPQIRYPKPRRSNIHPVDLGDALTHLRLGIGAAAKMCGVSIRQLSYWSDKGVFSSDPDSKSTQKGRTSSKKSSNRSRIFDYPAIEKACLIKQALDLGYSLEAAVSEAEAFLRRNAKEEKRLQRLSETELAATVGEQAQALSGLAERIRRGLRTYRVSGDLGRMAASSRGLERLISFFEANPYTVNTARQIALRLGRDVEGVTKELEVLEGQRFIQKISYPGNDIYRYLPRRK